MEFEDSRNALFTEPNAYIQNYTPKKESKKVVFSEPYECVPNYYLNNNFKKCNCDYCNKEKPKEHKECKNAILPKFDFKNLMPFLSMFNKGGNNNFSNILSLFGGKNNESNSGILSSILGNKDLVTNILKMFSGGLNLNKKETKQAKTTDFEINNYTKV